MKNKRIIILGGDAAAFKAALLSARCDKAILVQPGELEKSMDFISAICMSIDDLPTTPRKVEKSTYKLPIIE